MGSARYTYLTVGEAVEADLSVGDVIKEKLIDVANICRTTAPDAVAAQDHIDWLMQEAATTFPAVVLAGLIALMPRVEAGETCGAYGDRLLAEVTDAMPEIGTPSCCGRPVSRRNDHSLCTKCRGWIDMPSAVTTARTGDH